MKHKNKNILSVSYKPASVPRAVRVDLACETFIYIYTKYVYIYFLSSELFSHGSKRKVSATWLLVGLSCVSRVVRYECRHWNCFIPQFFYIFGEQDMKE